MPHLTLTTLSRPPRQVPSDKMDHLPEAAIELWHKVVPLGLIFFTASFNLTILQSLKDSIVVVAGGAETLVGLVCHMLSAPPAATGGGCGVDARWKQQRHRARYELQQCRLTKPSRPRPCPPRQPFLMSLCVLPASLAFFVLYGNLVRGRRRDGAGGVSTEEQRRRRQRQGQRHKRAILPAALRLCRAAAASAPRATLPAISSHLTTFTLSTHQVSALPERGVFYAAVAPLLAFYAVFAAFIYPASAGLHLDLSALQATLPAGLHGLVKVVGNWTYSLFFCFAELWGSVVISVLFW
jgi:hypothetical protein